jgi:hypothetical protein
MIDATWIDYWEKRYLDKYDDEGPKSVYHTLGRGGQAERT